MVQGDSVITVSPVGNFSACVSYDWPREQAPALVLLTEHSLQRDAGGHRPGGCDLDMFLETLRFDVAAIH